MNRTEFEFEFEFSWFLLCLIIFVTSSVFFSLQLEMCFSSAQWYYRHVHFPVCRTSLNGSS